MDGVPRSLGANCQGTWTINALTAQVKYYFTFPVRRLITHNNLGHSRMGTTAPALTRCAPPAVQKYRAASVVPIVIVAIGLIVVMVFLHRSRNQCRRAGGVEQQPLHRYGTANRQHLVWEFLKVHV